MRYHFLWILSLLSTSISALTLDDAYRFSASHHEQIGIQQEKINQAKAKRDQAMGALLPYVSFFGSETYQDASGNSDGSGVSSTLTHSNRPEYKVSVKQSLFSGFRDRDTVAALDSQIRRETIYLDQTKRLLFQRVAQAYFRALSIQKDLQNIQAVLRLSASQLADLQRRVRLGKSRENELLSAQAQSLNFQGQEALLKGQLTSAKLALSMLITVPITDELAFTVSEPSSPPDLQEILSHVSQNPDLLARQEDLASQTLLKSVAEHGTMPNLNLGGNYYLKRTTFLDPIKWDVAVTLDIPFYQGGTDAGLIRESESLRQQIILDLAERRRQIVSDITSDHVTYTASIGQISLMKQAYEKARKSYGLYQEDYRLGLINNLEVLQALNNLLEMRRALDQSEVAFSLAEIQLKLDRQELP